MSYPLLPGVIWADGNYTVAKPINFPSISYPMTGDGAINIAGSNTDIIYPVGFPDHFSLDELTYVRYPLGTQPNVYQEPQGAQSTVWHAVVLEQDFIVMQAAYQPIALNSPYDTEYWQGAAWGGGTLSQFCQNFNLPVNASDPFYPELFLVKEFPLEDKGAGMWIYRRQYASIPPTRNIYEKFTYNYPGLGAYSGSGQFALNRPDPVQLTVNSRLQIDYVILDSYGILSGSASPALNPWPNGLVLTIFDPTDSSFFLQPFQAYAPGSESGLYVPTNNLVDSTTDDSDDGSNPDVSDWAGWMGPNLGDGTGTTVASIIAEASYILPYMGNIWQRITRFVPVQ